jgi:serine/threonine-protein kinase RsbW
MNPELELTVAISAAERSRTLDAVEAFGQQHGIPLRALHDVQLAIEEHLTNIQSYAYDAPGNHVIIVRLRLERDALRVEVEDDGCPFNPMQHSGPDLSLPLDQRPVGGLGIHMMRKLMDSLEYQRKPNRNVLVMRKRTSGGGGTRGPSDPRSPGCWGQ